MVVLLPSSPPAFILTLELELPPRLVVLLVVCFIEFALLTLVVLELFAVFNLEDARVDEDVADLVFDFVLEAADEAVESVDGWEAVDTVEVVEAVLLFEFIFDVLFCEVSLIDFSSLEVVLCSWDDSSVTDDDIATVTEELTTVFS